MTEPGDGRRYGPWRWLAMAAAALALAACNHSAPPGAGALACPGLEIADHSARSLPLHVTPRPGPGVLYAPPPRAPQLENTGIWRAPPILISGASAYRCGEFLYQDWIYDDRGAAGVPDPEDPHSATSYLFSSKAGTLTYPTDPLLANNAADLVELRIRPLADATAFRVTLNTLQDLERVAFTLALGDSDALQDWPHQAGVVSPARYFVTVHGGSAELRDAADGSVLTPAPGVSVDLARRQIEVRVAHAAWNPGQETVRVAAGVGLWDAAAGEYQQPGPSATDSAPGGSAISGAALFNLAFRGHEPLPEFSVFSGRTIADAAVLARLQSHWWRERAQADALALGDVSEFHALVDFAKLAQGINDDSAVPQTGFMNRIFASRFEFGQGMDYSRACGGISASRPCDGTMVGQLQPYAIYVPEKPVPAGGYGLTLLLHALSANYNQYLGSRHATQFGERGAGTLVVTPAGRGPDGFYFDVAEADVFEVWADVARHYPLDPDWVVMSGVSMGGIGTFRLAGRYPDLLARVMPIVAAAGRYAPQLPSLRHVPVMMWNALFDELQPVVSTEATVTAMIENVQRFDVLRFETWDHLTPSTNDEYGPGADFLGEARVERNPPRVTYVLAPAEDELRVDVIADRAYWLSGLRVRDESAGSGFIDVRSDGFGLAEPEALPVDESVDVLSGGNHEPAPYTRRVLAWAPPGSAPVRNRLVIRASNIAAVTVHAARAQVSCGAELDIDSDGPIEVTLAGCP
jgi:hypothetical protein